jgi:F420H(2)-dependent quinone reductase
VRENRPRGQRIDLIRRRQSASQRLLRTVNRYVEPGVRAVGPPIVGPGIVVIETTGRRTGRRRRVPLLGWRHGRTVTVSTVRAASDWVRNLERLPVAKVWIAGRPRTSTATWYGHRRPRSSNSAMRRVGRAAASILRPNSSRQPLHGRPTRRPVSRRITLSGSSVEPGGCTSMIDDVIDRWHRYRRSGLPDALDELLDDDVTYYSPVDETPVVGKQLAKRHLLAAAGIFPHGAAASFDGAVDRFRYTKQVTADDTAVLEFEADLYGIAVNGVDVIRCNEAGRIVEFRIFIRPLPALNAVQGRARAAFEGL